MQNLSANDTVSACILDFAKTPMKVYHDISRTTQKQSLSMLSLIKGISNETKNLSTLKLNIEDISQGIKNIPSFDKLQSLLRETIETASTLQMY